jgi:tRNA(Ile2) C34 agmatinyltransferase TiaS
VMIGESPESGSGNPPCPRCGGALEGSDLQALVCPHCGKELPPRLGI